MMESLKIVDIFQSFKMSIWGKMKHGSKFVMNIYIMG